MTLSTISVGRAGGLEESLFGKLLNLKDYYACIADRQSY